MNTTGHVRRQQGQIIPTGFMRHGMECSTRKKRKRDEPFIYMGAVRNDRSLSLSENFSAFQLTKNMLLSIYRTAGEQ